MNDINLLYVGVDAAVIVLIVLLAIRLVSQTTNAQLILLIIWLSLGVICNVITTRQDYGELIAVGFRVDLEQLYPLFNLLRNSISGALMLACHIVFRDSNRLPPILLGLWIVQLLLEEPAAWVLGTGWNPVLETLLYEAVPAILQLLIAATAFYWMLSTRDADLVLPRRMASTLVLAVFFAQAVLSLLVERIAFQLGWVPTEWMYPVHVFVTALSIPLTGILLFASFSPNTALVLGARRDPTPVEASPGLVAQDDTDAGRIRAALEDERIYRTPGLSVHGLAEHLALPEYRLRNLVHQHLEFRNFNALLHHYRVGEVCEALADPQQNTTPVLTLALSAGYQSINPFNRAFREIHGVTPTAYRRQQQNQQQHEVDT